MIIRSAFERLLPGGSIYVLINISQAWMGFKINHFKIDRGIQLSFYGDDDGEEISEVIDMGDEFRSKDYLVTSSVNKDQIILILTPKDQIAFKKVNQLVEIKEWK